MPPSWVLLTNTVEIQTVYCDCMLVIEPFLKTKLIPRVFTFDNIVARKDLRDEFEKGHPQQIPRAFSKLSTRIQRLRPHSEFFSRHASSNTHRPTFITKGILKKNINEVFIKLCMARKIRMG